MQFMACFQLCAVMPRNETLSSVKAAVMLKAKPV